MHVQIHILVFHYDEIDYQLPSQWILQVWRVVESPVIVLLEQLPRTMAEEFVKSNLDLYYQTIHYSFIKNCWEIMLLVYN